MTFFSVILTISYSLSQKHTTEQQQGMEYYTKSKTKNSKIVAVEGRNLLSNFALDYHDADF